MAVHLHRVYLGSFPLPFSCYFLVSYYLCDTLSIHLIDTLLTHPGSPPSPTHPFSYLTQARTIGSTNQRKAICVWWHGRGYRQWDSCSCSSLTNNQVPNPSHLTPVKSPRVNTYDTHTLSLSPDLLLYQTTKRNKLGLKAVLTFATYLGTHQHQHQHTQYTIHTNYTQTTREQPSNQVDNQYA